MGLRFGEERLFFLYGDSLWLSVAVYVATVLTVSTPIKIWNNARIEHRLQEQEKLLLAAKVEALKSQINPHFLFNTLASVSSLIRSQPDTARMVIQKLSGLLRKLMRNDEQFVTLREELEAIDEYLAIEVIRFGPRLTVEKNIAPETLDIVVPSMLLQPLVENAIKHGLSRKVGAGRITLRAWRNRDTAIIEVEDDGLGISDERLPSALSSGIGLHNVHERLRVLYGAIRPARPVRGSGQGRAGARRDSAGRGPAKEAGVMSGHPLDGRRGRRRTARAGKSLCFLLGQMEGVEVVGQASNGMEAVEAIARLDPDVVFLDIQMPGLTGLEVVRQLNDSGTDRGDRVRDGL